MATESFTPSSKSPAESDGKVMSDGALMHVEENAMEVSWKEVFPDNSDMDDRLASELNTLVSFSIASFRLFSLVATTVLGVLAVSVPLLDVLPCSVVLSCKAITSCLSTLSSAARLPECLEDSPTTNKTQNQAAFLWKNPNPD